MNAQNLLFKKRGSNSLKTKNIVPNHHFCDRILLFQGILLNQTPLALFDTLIISHKKNGINCN